MVTTFAAKTSTTRGATKQYVAVELWNNTGGSDKTYALMVDATGTLIKAWGPRSATASGKYSVNSTSFGTVTAAAAAAVKIIESKTAKGYRVYRRPAGIYASERAAAAPSEIPKMGGTGGLTESAVVTAWFNEVRDAFSSPSPYKSEPEIAPMEIDPFVDDDLDGSTGLPAMPSTTAAEELPSAEVVYLRPNGQHYHPRLVNGHVQDVSLLRQARDRGMSVLLESAPGSGKTSACEAAFFVDGVAEYEHFVGSANTEESHLVGRMVPDADGRFRWHDGPLTRAIRRKVPFIYDEINLVDPTVNALLHPCMDGSNRLVIEEADSEELTWEAGSGFCVIASYNPNAMGGMIDDPLMSRFALRVAFTTDWTIARKLGVPKSFCEFGRELNKVVSSGSSSLSWAPQMREALDFREVAAAFGEDFAWAATLSKAPVEEQDEISVLIGEKSRLSKVRRLETNQSV